MAPAGLKVGDTFVDGGSTYQVDKVYPNGNYSSHMVFPKKKQTRTKTAVK